MKTVIDLLSNFMLALFMTIAIEELVAFIFGCRKKLEFVIVALVNVLTNPLMMLYYTCIRMYYPNTSFILLQLPGEILVVINEAFVYSVMGKTDRYKFEHPILISVICNTVSWTLGVLMQIGGLIK